MMLFAFDGADRSCCLEDGRITAAPVPPSLLLLASFVFILLNMIFLSSCRIYSLLFALFDEMVHFPARLPALFACSCQLNEVYCRSFALVDVLIISKLTRESAGRANSCISSASRIARSNPGQVQAKLSCIGACIAKSSFERLLCRHQVLFWWLLVLSQSV